MSLDAANNYKYKANLKKSVGKPLLVEETSLYGREYKDNGSVNVVGPCAYTSRKWYATVTLKDGLIVAVQ